MTKDYRKFMTEGEIEHILKIWEETGGSTSFYAVLKGIATEQIK